MSWTRAVWFEYAKDGSLEEFEQTLPSNWVKGNKVFWPNKNVESSLKKMSNPTDDWYQFKLKYIKLTDDDKEVCEEYGDNVTAGELDNNEMMINYCPSSSKKHAIIKSIPMPVPPKMIIRTVTPDTNVPQKVMRNNSSQKISSGYSETSSIQSGYSGLTALSTADIPKPFMSTTTSSMCDDFSVRKPTLNSPTTISMLESSFTNVSTNSPAVISQSYMNYNRKDSACARDKLISSKNLEDNGFQHIVLRRLAQITLQINEISKKLDTINGTRMKDDEGDILIQFDDIDALYEFDRKLGADKRVFKKFVNQLSSIGGNNGKKSVANMINRIN
ncbi:uncharacterized protein LOC136076489 isoform X3 [Hydra vulgaris]|uniref:Uncharacterized protein LOC136076489 isoform X3 n=1 Tax=Hydra vulgaris TaxID=6087 RepID=A0ABM4BAI5_HYDVU